jgi:Tol biopolymer transport system component
MTTWRGKFRGVVRAALAVTVVGLGGAPAASAADQGRIVMSVGGWGSSIFNTPAGAWRKLEVVDLGSGSAQFVAGTGDEPHMDDPTWGADGSKIAYLVEYQNEVNGKNYVVLKSVEDGTEQTIVSGLNGRIDGPSLSPAGDAIAYWLVAYDPDCGTCYTHYVKPLNGQGSTRTLAGPFQSGDLRLPGDPVAWSPDGERLAFS